MRFAMSTSETLRAAVGQLRDAGYEDASQAGDPEHVLSVSVDGVGCRIQVEWNVTSVDQASRVLSVDGQDA